MGWVLSQFDAYQVAKSYYLECKKQKVPYFLHGQLMRAASSIVLNIAEGSAKRSPADQKRFYGIALGSLRECQAITDMENKSSQTLTELSDRLGAMLFKMSRKT